MKYQIDLVKKLAKEKKLPLQSKDLQFLIFRIQQELNEVKDAETFYQAREELIDVLIQTIQALIASGADIEKEFDKKMKRNFKRDFSRHFK